uniref:Uncharacterized protein n=1 Tax=Solanum lycopersicum TaxID=4081 RepID=A0A3Q7H6C3_SOLLC
MKGKEVFIVIKVKNTNRSLVAFKLTFLDHLQTPGIIDKFLKVMGSEGKMQMVMYGIGSNFTDWGRRKT